MLCWGERDGLGPPEVIVNGDSGMKTLLYQSRPIYHLHLKSSHENLILSGIKPSIRLGKPDSLKGALWQKKERIYRSSQVDRLRIFPTDF